MLVADFIQIFILILSNITFLSMIQLESFHKEQIYVLRKISPQQKVGGSLLFISQNAHDNCCYE